MPKKAKATPKNAKKLVKNESSADLKQPKPSPSKIQLAIKRQRSEQSTEDSQPSKKKFKLHLTRAQIKWDKQRKFLYGDQE